VTTLSGHLTDAQAQRLVDGQPDPALDEGAAAHAAACPGCGGLVESYRALAGALDGLELPEAPPGFTAGVLARIEAVEAAQARERRLAIGILACVLLAVAGALAAAGVGGLGASVGGLAGHLGEASRALRVGAGVVPGLLSALRLQLLLGAAAVAVPLLMALARLMPAPRTQAI
jgi:uncharacterized membrane protein YgcG